MKPMFLICWLLTTCVGWVGAQRQHGGNVGFDKADSVAMRYRRYSLTDLKGLAIRLTPFQDDVQNFRSIYYWVTHYIRNDYNLFAENKRQRIKHANDPEALNRWNAVANQRMFDRLLRKRITICTGYAYLIRELSAAAGIECVIVDGYGRTAASNVDEPARPNHSWNAVKLNRQWYLCDATWSSGSLNLADGSRSPGEEGYFLADTRLFVRNHFPLDTAWFLLRHKPSLQKFMKGPLVYNAAFKFGVDPIEPPGFDVTMVKGDSLRFVLRSIAQERKPQRIFLQVMSAKGMDLVYPKVRTQADGLLTFAHLFNQRGKFTVHLLTELAPAVTYRIEVVSAELSSAR